MINVGRLGQLLIAEEDTYAVTPTLLASMAMRHLDFGATYNPFNRVASDEKKATRGRRARFTRAATAGFDLRRAFLRPSGTIATVPECHKLLQHGLGTAIVGTLNTTVASASSASVFTLQAGQGANVTVGEWVLVKRAASAVPEPRQVVAKSTDTITVSPALGATPVAADTVKAGVTYKLGSITKSLSLVHYLTNLTRVVKGGVVQQLGVSFERNAEVILSANGPAQQAPKGAPASPGFTTVGAQNPPSGLVGGLRIAGTAYKFLSFELQHNNGLDLINENFGTSMAEGYDEPDWRDITFSLDARVTEDFALYDLAEAGTRFELFLHAGATEGNIVALRAPQAELAQVPELPDDNGRLTYSFAGSFNEDSVGNDEYSIGLL
jgi:hypothetical protein